MYGELPSRSQRRNITPVIKKYISFISGVKSVIRKNLGSLILAMLCVLDYVVVGSTESSDISHLQFQ